MAKGGTLANIGQALAGYGSALSGNPLYLQNVLIQRQAQQQEQEREQAARQAQVAKIATQSLFTGGSEMTPERRMGMLGMISPEVLQTAVARQAVNQLFPQGFSGTLSEGQTAFQDGRVVASAPRTQDRKLPAEAELAMFITGGDHNAARQFLQQRDTATRMDTGLNPIYGRDAQGNVVVMQPTKSGQLVQSGLPEGVTPLAPREMAFERAAGQAGGKVEGERVATAPAVIATAEASLKNIRDLKNSKSLPRALGPIEGRLPAIGGAQADIIARIDQIGGQAFLQAFENLKGGGQITEIEGARATAAMARLNRTQTPEDFLAALTELENVVAAGLERAKRGRSVQYGATGSWSIQKVNP